TAHTQVIVGLVVGFAFSGTACGHDEQVGQLTVTVQIERAESSELGLVTGTQHHGARPVTEDRQGRAIRGADQGGECVGPDHQYSFRDTTRDQSGCGGECVDEPGADRVDIERSSSAEPQFAGDLWRAGRTLVVGCCGGEYDGVDCPGVVGGVH